MRRRVYCHGVFRYLPSYGPRLVLPLLVASLSWGMLSYAGPPHDLWFWYERDEELRLLLSLSGWIGFGAFAFGLRRFVLEVLCDLKE